jgi:hypothetical protein
MYLPLTLISSPWIIPHSVRIEGMGSRRSCPWL